MPTFLVPHFYVSNMAASNHGTARLLHRPDRAVTPEPTLAKGKVALPCIAIFSMRLRNSFTTPFGIGPRLPRRQVPLKFNKAHQPSAISQVRITLKSLLLTKYR